MAKETKKINTTDLLFLILLMVWLYELDLSKLTAVKYIGMGAAAVWFALFFKKTVRR